MKRIFSVIAAIAIAGLAALCVYCVAAGVASDANKAASIYAPGSNAVEMMEEQESVKFSSLQAYIDYMTGGNGAASANSVQQSSGYYYVPANLPEDITVTSVEIVEDGTVFTYNVAREVLIDVALTDSDMRELFSTMQIKVYDTVSEQPYDFITDTAAYAENLAKSLNAQRVSSSAPISSLYYGAANVRWQADDGSYSTIAVGRQMVWIEDTDTTQIHYGFYPLSVSQDEALAISSLTRCPIGSNINVTE